MGRREKREYETPADEAEGDPAATESELAPKTRKTRSKRNPDTMSPLDAQLHRVRQTFRVLEIVKDLDPDTKRSLYEAIGKLNGE